MKYKSETNRFLNILMIFIWVLTVIFTVDAGTTKIKKIKFYGNEHYSAKKLKKIIFLKKNKKFDKRQLKIDKILIKNFYFNNGYLDVWVDDFYKKNEDGITVKFNIAEGKKYYFDSVTIVGDDFIPEDLFKKITKKIKQRATYNQVKVDRMVTGVEDYYYNNGFPYIKIQAVNEIHNDSLVTVQLNINAGARVNIDKISIIGLRKVKRYVVEREIEFKKGELYSRENINKTQRTLYATGLFETVNMQVKPQKEDSGKAVIVVQVSEKKARYLGIRAGLGYEENSATGATLDITGEFGHLNLFGTGRLFSTLVVPSFSYDFQKNSVINPQNQFSVSYREPWFMGTKMPATFTVGYYQRNLLNSPDYDVWNYSVKTNKALRRNWKVASSLEYQYITNIESAGQDTLRSMNLPVDNQQVVGIRFVFTRDKRNNMIIPTRGYLTELNFGISRTHNPETSASRSSNAFYGTFQFAWNRYQRFSFIKKWILASRIKLGYIHFIDKESMLPLTEMFTLGGSSTIRGYGEQLVGPFKWVDGNRIATGGKILYLNNIELRMPVVDMVYLTAFTDAGYVWDDYKAISPNDIRIGTGGGVAVSLQVIVIRLEYGFKLIKKSYEKPGLWHFGVSFAF